MENDMECVADFGDVQRQPHSLVRSSRFKPFVQIQRLRQQQQSNSRLFQVIISYFFSHVSPKNDFLLLYILFYKFQNRV